MWEFSEISYKKSPTSPSYIAMHLVTWDIVFALLYHGIHSNIEVTP